MTANLLTNYSMLTPNKLEHLEARVGDVKKCLSQMDTTKALGPDGIIPRLHEEGANQLAPLLSLSISRFSKAWTLANVIPLCTQ
jgi:hypothetical protein